MNASQPRDRSVAERPRFSIRRAPLLPVAVGMMGGILATDEWSPPAGVWTVVGAMGAAIGLLLTRRGGGLVAASGGWICVVLLGAAVGGIRLEHATRPDADDVARLIPPDSDPLARVRGVILTPPRVEEPLDASEARAYETEPRTRFLLRVSEVDLGGGWIATAGRVRVAIGAAALHVAAGDSVEVLGHLYAIRGPRNPGEYDWAARARREGTPAGMYCGSERNVRRIGRAPGGATGWLGALRMRLRRLLLDDVPPDDDGAQTLLDAMVLGQRGQVERSLDRAFVQSGTVHFLCASGMNIAWLASAVWFVSMVVGLHYRTCAAVSAVAAVAYTLMAEPNPPIARAAVTGCLFFASRWLRRPATGGNWLAAAVCVLLLWSPADLFDAGFQLSFACVAGIVLLAAPLIREIPHEWRRADGTLLLPADRVWGQLAAWTARAVCVGAIVSLASWLVSLPITAWHFGRVGCWGWLTSLLMAPLVFVVTLAGFAKLLLSALFPTLSVYGGFPLGLLTGWLADMARWFPRLPGCQIEAFAPPVAALVAYYVLLFAAIYGPRPRWRGSSAVAAGVILLLSVGGRFGGSAAELRVTVLAVGDGNAVIVEFPNGRTMACDLGTRSNFDAAERVILPFLRARRISRLEVVDISHPDFDHYGAVAAVAARVGVGEVRVNRLFPLGGAADSGEARLLAELKKLAVPVRVHGVTGVLSPDAAVTIERRWPPNDGPAAGSLADNDTSTVLRLSYSGKSMLITGDIVEQAQAALTAAGALNSDVLLIPHHGSPRPPTLPEFTRAVNPSVLIRSSGLRDRDTGDRLWQAVGQRRYYNTADCGAVTVRLSKRGVVIETMRPTDAAPHKPPADYTTTPQR